MCSKQLLIYGVAGPAESTQPSQGSSHSSVPRGPPRKPRQSGHALWVGNLPPATNVMELKDYFSREATNDIESVFLISKSNCAFVNYKSEEACSMAMARFHDSRFKGVRLVCRLRRPTRTGADEDGEFAPRAQVPHEALSNKAPVESAAEPAVKSEASQDQKPASGDHDDEKKDEKKDRYFILKSLTVEDLESSVRNGVWSTQRHNEAVLNEAYSVSLQATMLCL